MQAVLTAEQRMLQEVAAGWLAERFPPERVAQIADADVARDAKLWAELGDLGWIGLDVPATLGGGDATLVEAALIAEQCGRALLPAPLLSATALALPVLLAAADTKLLTAVLAGERSVAVATCDDITLTDGALTGTATDVLDLPVVSDVLVTIGDAAYVVGVDDPGVVVEPRRTVDGTRWFGQLRLDGARGEVVLDRRDNGVTAAIRTRGLVLLAAESVGVGQWGVDAGVEHAKVREQFGRLIGSYQGVAFALADAYAAVERARSLTYYAAWSAAQARPDALVLAAGARIAAVDAATFATERAIQTYGGLGMTWDALPHRWYKRALVNQTIGQSARALRDTIADALFPISEGS